MQRRVNNSRAPKLLDINFAGSSQLARLFKLVDKAKSTSRLEQLSRSIVMGLLELPESEREAVQGVLHEAGIFDIIQEKKRHELDAPLENAKTLEELEGILRQMKDQGIVHFYKGKHAPNGKLQASRRGDIELNQRLFSKYITAKRKMMRDLVKIRDKGRKKELKARAKEENEANTKLFKIDGAKVVLFIGESKKGRKILRVERVINGLIDLTPGSTYRIEDKGGLTLNGLPQTLKKALSIADVQDFFPQPEPEPAQEVAEVVELKKPEAKLTEDEILERMIAEEEAANAAIEAELERMIAEEEAASAATNAA